MNISEARKLKPGNLVKQKQHGYILSVVSIEDRSTMQGVDYVKITCSTPSGELMKYKHKELLVISKGQYVLCDKCGKYLFAEYVNSSGLAERYINDNDFTYDEIKDEFECNECRRNREV